MAKPPRDRGKPQRPNSPNQNSDKAKAAGPAIEAAKPDSKEMKNLEDIAKQEDLKVSKSDIETDVPQNITPMSVVDAYKRHLAAEKVYLEAKAKVIEEEDKLKVRGEKLLESEIQFAEREDEIKEGHLELEKRKKDFLISEKSVNERVAEFTKKSSELDARERTLAEKEQDLLTGRLSEAYEMYVRPLEDKRSEILNQISEHIGTTQDSVRSQWVKVLSDIEEGNDEFRQKLILKMKEIDEQRIEVTAAQGSIDVERQLLDAERELLEKQRQELRDVQSEELETRRVRLEVEYQSRREALVRREEEALSIVRKGEFITEWEDTLGDVDGVVNNLEGLKATIKNYELELAKRRSLIDESELLSLRTNVAGLSEELEQLRADYQAKTKESAATTSMYLEATAKFDEVENLKSTIEQYRKQRDQLKADMDHLSGVKTADSPFSECSSMDRDVSLQSATPLQDASDFSLSRFVDQMQWMLYNPLPDKGSTILSYYKDDLRVFVAGLHTSRLHILEGVSGTGKTSLPIAFVRAIGGGDSNVAIQAGWRDRQDLLGYFNEFQKEFRETDFLRGVYRAMTPKFSSSPYFVILDEMNLSKVEQYFADYLKGLEDAAGADVERGGSVPLMDKKVPMPRFLQEGKNGGIELPLPPNIWFVGTANQDESTQSFAPKTQSRAHIMELPHMKPSDKEMESEIGGETYSRFQSESLGLDSLQKAFSNAERNPVNKAHTEKAKLIFDELREVISKIDSGLSLGPRFDRQVEAFVPIIMETGGSLALAIDHLVFSKFIRRMNENYKITTTHRKTLSDSLESVWKKNSFGDCSKTKSHNTLNKD